MSALNPMTRSTRADGSGTTENVPTMEKLSPAALSTLFEEGSIKSGSMISSCAEPVSARTSTEPTGSPAVAGSTITTWPKSMPFGTPTGRPKRSG